jgi:hypothetical protein
MWRKTGLPIVGRLELFRLAKAALSDLVGDASH